MNTSIVLKNGKRVANFSSPHPFAFDDGSVLPAVSNEEAERLKVTFIEKEEGNGDVSLSFALSKDVLEEMQIWWNLYSNNRIDVVFVPLPMMTAIKEHNGLTALKNSPFRCIRIVDRINKVVSSTTQCI